MIFDWASGPERAVLVSGVFYWESTGGAVDPLVSVAAFTITLAADGREIDVD